VGAVSGALAGLRAIWRVAITVLHVLLGALICAVAFPFIGPAPRMRIVGWWSAGMLVVLGIRLSHSDSIGPGPLLLVANHISWLDILAINAVQPARFVSKSDVRHWPLLGWLVACGGTLFIERERKRDALRVVHQVAAALTTGEIIAVFPEGTTGEGHDVLPFHANLLQAAVATHTPVQALALRYSDSRQPVSAAAAYVGDTPLAASIWATAMAHRLGVQVQISAPRLTVEGVDRRELAEQLRHDIVQGLELGARQSACGRG
jgi:1-acyl-sn-glycerol-3-phosphate acyltransferase